MFKRACANDNLGSLMLDDASESDLGDLLLYQFLLQFLDNDTELFLGDADCSNFSFLQFFN